MYCVNTIVQQLNACQRQIKSQCVHLLLTTTDMYIIRRNLMADHQIKFSQKVDAIKYNNILVYIC